MIVTVGSEGAILFWNIPEEVLAPIEAAAPAPEAEPPK